MSLENNFDFTKPVHPSVILKKYVDTANPKEFAKVLGIHWSHFKVLLEGSASLTVDDAFKLTYYFRTMKDPHPVLTSVKAWLDIQQNHDIDRYLKGYWGPYGVAARKLLAPMDV